jgi:4'-phosphopantetheinyl transferase
MLPLDPSWPEPPAHPTLPPGEIHVWRVALDRPPDELAALASLLSPEEHTRAARYRFHNARGEFIAGRAALRSILAAYLVATPRELLFDHGAQGKPRLRGDAPPLYFNLSHSHGLALVAVTPAVEIGVDVERVRTFANQQALAERFFAPREVAALLTVAEAERPTAFFHAWTRKEAFVKAWGVGISYGVERVEVTLLPGEPAHLLCLDGCAEAATAWSLSHLEPAPGYVGAVALEGNRGGAAHQQFTFRAR